VNDLAAAALLGIVQGLTEFLPVSSTAHLILVSDLLKLDPERLSRCIWAPPSPFSSISRERGSTSSSASSVDGGVCPP